MLRAWRRWMGRNKQPPRRRLGVEALEDRTVPAFVTAPTYSVGYAGVTAAARPVAIASGDFNGDGLLDVATANQNSNSISILRGNGAGGFALATGIVVRKDPSAIVAADLNGDGRLDLVTANKSDNSISVVLNAGPFFRAPLTYAAGTGPVSVAVGDFNGDQKPDLAVADTGASTVTLLMGTGLGTFNSPHTIAVGNNPTSVTSADFNGDGKLDLASVSGGFGYLDVNLGHGDGTFDGPVNYETGFVAYSVVVGDFNHDQQPDLAVACKFPSNDGVSILLGNPDGTFQTFARYAVAGNPLTLVLGDFDGDGVQDIATANAQFDNNSVSVLMGHGDGTFGGNHLFAAGQNPTGLVAGDFNRDGLLDFVAADNQTSGSTAGVVSVLLGNGDGTLLAAPHLSVSNPGPITSTDLTGEGIPDLAVISSSGVTVFAGLGHGAFGQPLLTSLPHHTSLAFGKFNADAVPDLVVTTDTGVVILLGNGDGTFAAPLSFAAGANPSWVAVADFNGDTFADLAVANNSGTDGASILLGNGDGTFAAAASIAVGGKANHIVAADLNGDQRIDLAVVNPSINKISIVRGTGTGTFGTPTSIATQVDPASISMGDFNRDGRIDLAVPTFFGPGLTVFIQSVTGAFVKSAEYDVDSRPIGSAAIDLNGDGKLDLVTANNFGDTISVLGGSGLGTFGGATNYVVGDGPNWIAAGDLNGDGRPDLAVSNRSGTITLLQTPLPATQLRVTVVPDAVTAGAVFDVTVRAVDANNRLVTGFTGPVSLASTDGFALLPAAYTFTVADKGVHRFKVTLRTAGPQTVVANMSGSPAGSDAVTVAPAAMHHFNVGAAPGPVAGVAFDVTVQAADAFGNVVPTYQGTVHFAANDPASPTVPGDYTFTAADNGVYTFPAGVLMTTAGARTLTVAAGALQGSTPINLQAAAATHLTLSTGAAPIAGASLNVTVTARDVYENLAADFTGTLHFTSTDLLASLPVDYTFTAADKGLHVFKAALKTAAVQSLTVTSAGVADGEQLGIQVKPAAASQLTFVQQPTNTFAATRFVPPVSVLAKDAFGNLVVPGTKVALRLVRNPSLAALVGSIAATDVNGVATFPALTVSAAGRGYLLAARVGLANSAASTPFTVYTASHFRLIVSSTKPQAGATFTVTVIAQGALNRTDTSYVGTIHFTSTSVLANLPADYTFLATDRGVKTFTVGLNNAGVRTLTATDTLKATVRGVVGVTVLPGAAVKLLVSGYPTSTTVNAASDFTVTALDAYDNIATGYVGLVQFTNAGGTATLPAAYRFTTLDKGKRVFSAMFLTAGDNQSLIATDADDASINGTEDGISVAGIP